MFWAILLGWERGEEEMVQRPGKTTGNVSLPGRVSLVWSMGALSQKV